MAKKRIYEFAKERDIPSAQLLRALKASGVKVKAAASSVDEEDVKRAMDAVGATEAEGEPAGATVDGRVDEEKAEPVTRLDEQKAGKAKGQGTTAKVDGGKAKRLDVQHRARPAVSRKRAEGGAGRRRRVVIDSQASRRKSPVQPRPQKKQRPRRRRSRKPVLKEPVVESQETEVTQELDVVKIPSGSTVKDISAALGVQVPELIKKLMTMGEMASITQTLSDEAIQVLADAIDRRVEITRAADDVLEEPEFEDREEDLQPRPPVVTIMGHVDHGKTSLIDAIRETGVAEGEAGGITQHIGAYQVHHNEGDICVLDTPGHEAFTAMRARGAKVTDIATIVVAADDGVMPQTLEAIDHAKAAEVPMVIAVNKIDKENANPDRVRNELASRGLTPEEWGGETIFCDVSAKTMEGLDNLLDMIQLVAEVSELKANPSAPFTGAVIESRLDPGRGPVVTVLVQRGTLSVGDSLVAGSWWARVRAMHDYSGNRIQAAGPSAPVEVLGFDGVPDAGEHVRAVENDRSARQLAAEQARRLRTEKLARRQTRVSLDDLFDRAKRGVVKELNLIIKADVMGSLEVIEDEIAKLPQEQIQVKVIHTGIGGINESDVMLASASEAVVIGFNVRPLADAHAAADRENVEIRTYSVIYKMTKELRAAMEGMLEPEEVQEDIGTVEIRQVFRSSRAGVIAGCYVTDGLVNRNAEVRLVRDGTIAHEGSLASLKRHKDDVREVKAGLECGIVLKDFTDIKEGDVLELYQTKKVERKL